MSELSYLKKTSTVGFGHNSYTAITHDHVTESLQPLCVKYGIVLEPSMTETEISMYEVKNKKGETSNRYEARTTACIRVINIDNPDETTSVSAMAHGFDSQDKAPGKAYSMAVKYCYLKLFMLASGDREEDRAEVANIEDLEPLQDEMIKLLMETNGEVGKASMDAINKMSGDQLRAKIQEYNKKEK